ncbi:MAG: ParB/RepB/Spo0J family partition protein [Bdellovibrionales bacterium]
MNAKPQTKPAPLGRGLSALFGDADASYQPRKQAARAGTAPSTSSPVAGQQGIRSMPITWIQPGMFQPRHHFDEQAIEELAASIRERGILQPLMIRPLEGDKDSYEIICGERRWRAAQQAGLHDVPVIVKNLTDSEAMEVGLIENVQRQDLSPLEEAEGYQRLIDEFHHRQDDLAKIVGKSRAHISNIIRLIKLPDSVKVMINDGSLSMGQARAIITAKDPETLAKEIVKKGLNVRQAEMLAKKESDGKFAKSVSRVAKNADPNILALERDLGRLLGLKVRIRTELGSAGNLTIHYADLDQFEMLLNKLKA